MLPNQDANREKIEASLAKHFEFAKSLTEWLYHIPARLFAKKDKRDSRVRAFVAATHIRELRRYSSIVALAKIGMTENVEILLRSQLEGLLSLRFVLQEPLPDDQLSGDLVEKLKRLPPMPKGEEGELFRLELYRGYELISLDRIAEKVRQLPEIAHMASDEMLSVVQKNLPIHRESVGDEWCKRQRASRSYSGLAIAELAESRGLLKEYRILYGVQCQASHCNDAFKFVEFSDEGSLIGRFATDLKGLRENLVLAAVWMGRLVEDVNKHYSLDLEGELRLMEGVIEGYRNWG